MRPGYSDGVTNDKSMSFIQHTDSKNTKAETSVNVLQALTNTILSQSNQDITLVYKQYIRPLLTYGHPAWQRDTKATHIQKLQIILIRALRIATGWTQTSHIPHLHRETSVLSSKQHMLTRRTHIYTSTDCPTQSLHHLWSTPARTQRAISPRTTVSKLYQTELDSLPLYRRTHHTAHTCTLSTPTEH